jgi:hypothetical protein
MNLIGPVFAMTYRTSVSRGPGGYEAVREHWEALAADARLFTQLPEWLENIGSDGVSWLVVTEDDRPVAAAALSVQKVRICGKSVRALSGVRQSIDDTYGHGLTLGAVAIADPKADGEAVADALIAGYRQSCGNWDVLWLSDVREPSPWLSARFGQVVPEEGVGAPIIETNQPSSQYWAAASGHLRHVLSASRRRLEKEGRQSQVVEARTPGEVADAFDQFVDLEGRGWKRDVGAFANRPESAAFVKRFLVSAARTRRAAVRSLLIDGHLAACHLSVQVQDTLFLMKITYDESLQHLSPGNLLMAELISKACDDQTIARIDCVEHASWHHRWSTITEPMFRLVAFNPRSATGLAAEVAWRGLGALGKQPSHLNKPAVVELISPEQVHLPSGRDAKP